MDSVQGSDGITPTSPQTGAVNLSGDLLLPRDGSRPMTGNLDGGGNDIAGMDGIFANVTIETPVFSGLGGGEATYNGVQLTTSGAGDQFLTNDGTYQSAPGGNPPGGTPGDVQIHGAGGVFEGTNDFRFSSNVFEVNHQGTGSANFTDGTGFNVIGAVAGMISNFTNISVINFNGEGGGNGVFQINGHRDYFFSGSGNGGQYTVNGIDQIALRADQQVRINAGTANDDIWPTNQQAGFLANDGAGTLSWQPGGGGSSGEGLETFSVVAADGNQFMTNNTQGRCYCMAAIPEVDLTIADISFVIAQNNGGGTGGVAIYDANGIRLAYSSLQAFALGANNIVLDQGGPVNLIGGQLYYMAIEANINACGPLSIQGASVYNPPVGPNVPPLAFYVPNSRAIDPTGFPPDVSSFFGQVNNEARKYYLLGNA